MYIQLLYKTRTVNRETKFVKILLTVLLLFNLAFFGNTILLAFQKYPRVIDGNNKH